MRRTIVEQRRHTKRLLLRRNGYQFGQRPSSCNLATRSIPGDVACADTSVQTVARILKGKYYSINHIRRLSKESYHVPMSVGHAVYALNQMGLDYEMRNDLTARELMVIARRRGPVLIAEDYWAHPQWKGYYYGGKKQTGIARNLSGRNVYVGFSDPEGHSGNNQWTFRLGHMVVLATSAIIDGKNVGYVRDPNHNSPTRPQRPAWDRISGRQLGRMMRSFNRGQYLVAIVPKRRLWK